MKLHRNHHYDGSKEHAKERKEYPRCTQGACKERPRCKRQAAQERTFMRVGCKSVCACIKTHLLQANGKIVSYLQPLSLAAVH